MLAEVVRYRGEVDDLESVQRAEGIERLADPLQQAPGSGRGAKDADVPVRARAGTTRRPGAEKDG